MTTYKVRHSHGHYVAQFDSPEEAQEEADRLHGLDEERRIRNNGVWSTRYAVDVISEVYTTAEIVDDEAADLVVPLSDFDEPRPSPPARRAH